MQVWVVSKGKQVAGEPWGKDQYAAWGTSRPGKLYCAVWDAILLQGSISWGSSWWNRWKILLSYAWHWKRRGDGLFLWVAGTMRGGKLGHLPACCWANGRGKDRLLIGFSCAFESGRNWADLSLRYCQPRYTQSFKQNTGLLGQNRNNNYWADHAVTAGRHHLHQPLQVQRHRPLHPQ